MPPARPGARHRPHRRGRPDAAVIPGAFTGGEIEISRGDLAALLYERTAGRCEYVFGDSITSLTETAGGVHVTFERGAPRTFDLVVGADGIHSNVRRLAFGPEADYVRFLGHYYALADIAAAGPAVRSVMYNEPGRMVSLWGNKASAFFVFASEPLEYDRWDPDQQKRLLARAYEGARWQVPEIVAALSGASEFYLDSISRVEIDHYARGRVVLVGDAAYGNTLGGFGTGLAVVGAYVLAGELAAAERRPPDGVPAVRGAAPRLCQGGQEGQRRAVPRPADPGADHHAEPDVQTQAPAQVDAVDGRQVRIRHRPRGLPGPAVAMRPTRSPLTGRWRWSSCRPRW